MIYWLSRFIRSRDAFGHPIQLTYKGRESYNSVLGGIFTLMAQTLTGVLIVTALQEIIFMDDPHIINYSKPLSPSRREQLLPVGFKKYNYVVAFNTK